MMKFQYRAAALALAAGALFAVSGCDDKTAAPAPATTTTTPRQSAPNQPPPSNPMTTTPVRSNGDAQAFCAKAQSDTGWLDELTDPTATTDEAKAAVKKRVSDLAAAAPAEIKADMDLIADTYAKVMDGELQALPTEQKVADTVQALMRVNNWMASHCPTS